MLLFLTSNSYKEETHKLYKQNTSIYKCVEHVIVGEPARWGPGARGIFTANTEPNVKLSPHTAPREYFYVKRFMGLVFFSQPQRPADF